MAPVGDDFKDHDRGGELGILHHKDYFDVLPDPPVLLVAPLQVLLQSLFIREEPGHSGGSGLELVVQSRCFDFS